MVRQRDHSLIGVVQLKGATLVIEGTVKWYNRKRGYGFITDELGAEVFVHYTDFHSSLKELSNGDAVCFKMVEGEKGPRALEVMLKTEAEEPETV